MAAPGGHRWLRSSLGKLCTNDVKRTATWVIYGANGFTGAQLVEEAQQRGLAPVLAGRSRASLERIAARHENGLPMSIRVASLEEPQALNRLLEDANLVLNAAGPYARTAMPLVQASLDTGTHYLDVSGELPVVERIAACHEQAVMRDVMLMPAVGYAVAPSDCLALRAKQLVPDATRLRVALSHFDLFAAGSAKSMISLVQNEVRIRRHGAMTTVPVGELERDFDFGAGPSRCTAINWCDSFTAYYASGIPNIEVYLEAGAWERWMYLLSSRNSGLIQQPLVQAWLTAAADWWFPDHEDRRLVSDLADRQRCMVVEATNDAGAGIQLRLTSPDPYRVTRDFAIAIVERVLAGDGLAGFQTPATVFGDTLLKSASALKIERRTIQQ